ncbi:MAG: hypothetical protein C4K60_00780 [Ideonella sp. MAG2]|nr:MAG: hypothetical protein C4K60_00780 [Ideonella sp. MAG2]
MGQVPPRHLILAFASATSEAALHTLGTLQLPHLEALLARLHAQAPDEGDEYSLNPPHERAWARACGWEVQDGLIPLAAQAAHAAGLAPPPGSGWALVSPAHWHAGTEQFSLLNPADLALDEASSRAAFEAVRPLFEEDGIRLHWCTPLQWLAEHESLAHLPTASLDRVIGRNVDLWLGPPQAARRLRRLQAEVQMLLHSHPLNQARDAQGLLPLNSFWLSGTGSAPPQWGTPNAAQCVETLRAPLLAEDWAAWAEAWHALDATLFKPLLAEHKAGAPLTLTLCGERHAQTWLTQAARGGLWRRWWAAKPAAATVLMAL